MANETCKKVYVDVEGKEHRSVPESVDRLEFRFANGETHTVKLDMFPEAVINAAMWHGFSQKLGDSYGGRGKDVTLEDKVVAFTDMLGQLQEGDWITAAEGGAPRTSQLAQAYMRAMAEEGQEIAEADAIAKVAEWSDDKKKSAKSVPAIAKHLAAIAAEAAAARAAKAAQAAEAAGAEGGPSLADL